MPTGISVVICCFNSAQRIVPTLHQLAAQTNITAAFWEVILVNNTSTDNTVEVAVNCWNELPDGLPQLKVVTETKQGLSSARKKGIKEASFDLVLFCDDDNWLNQDYLSIALEIMQKDPDIGALGGQGSPVFEGAEPPYFWVNQYHALAIGAQSVIEGDITNERGVLYGAGMIVRKKAFLILQSEFAFDFLLPDRTNNTLTSSGDHELCFALKIIGFKIFHSHRLKFQHYMPAFRTTIRYYKKLFLGFGSAYAMLAVYRINNQSLNALSNDYRYIIVRCIKSILLLQIRLLTTGYYFNRNPYKYIGLIDQFYNNIGVFKATLKVKNLYKQQFLTLRLFDRDKLKFYLQNK